MRSLDQLFNLRLSWSSGFAYRGILWQDIAHGALSTFCIDTSAFRVHIEALNPHRFLVHHDSRARRIPTRLTKGCPLRFVTITLLDGLPER